MLTIGLTGPSGAGKSSLAKLIAIEFGYDEEWIMNG